MRILLVKTSSMGDVIHNLPVVSDIAAALPDAQIDWVIEAPFAEIAALHPAIDNIMPVAVRGWRAQLVARRTWREMREFKQRLQSQRYDSVIDTQGLLKSAIITRFASGVRCGYDRQSIREPLAARFYDRAYAVGKNLHAVERNRTLAAKALNYTPRAHVDYGIKARSANFPWLPPQSYAVLVHATSAEAKLWPEGDWISLGEYFAAKNWTCILPWGNADERARAERLAARCESAVVAPSLRLTEAASLLSGAELVVGVDTGLTHLAAALDAPTIGIYCASDPSLTGLYAPRSRNIGNRGAPPTALQVIAVADDLLAV